MLGLLELVGAAVRRKDATIGLRLSDNVKDLPARLGMRAGDWAVLLSVAVVVAVCGVLGVSYVAGQGWPVLDVPSTVLLCVVAAVLAAILLLLADQALLWACTRGASGGATSRLASVTPQWSVRSIAAFSLVMALFWLPWLVANFPGGTYWDTYYQIFQCYPENHPIAVIPYAECYDNTLTDAYLCDHHPIFDTLVYGAFGMASDALTGSWMAGVFAFVCLQGAAHVVAFTAAVAYLRERHCPMVLCFAAYAFLCVMPFVSTWALCMVKDSFFGLFYIPYLIMLFEAVRTRGTSLESSRAVVAFALVGLMLCLTKKQGIYVVVPTALIAAWVYGPRGRLRAGGRARRARLARHAPVGGRTGDAERYAGGGHAGNGGERADNGGRRADNVERCAGSAGGRTGDACPPYAVRAFARPTRRAHAGWKAFLAQALLCVVVMLVIFPMLVFPLLNVAPGGKQEVLGTLFQQTARYVTYHGEEVTDEERAAIDAVLEYNNLSHQYTFNFQDEVKYRYKLDSTNDDLMRYLQVWAAQGLKHPEAYLASVMSIAGYYVAPCGVINIRMVTVDTHMGDDQRYMLYNPDELDWLRNGLADAYDLVAYTPGADLPLLMVVYVFWLPAALLFVMRRRDLRCGVLLLPALILLAFCVIAPVNDARYCIPLLDGAPLMVCMFAALLCERSQRGEGGCATAPPYMVGMR